jgi:hypothetical protein
MSMWKKAVAFGAAFAAIASIMAATSGGFPSRPLFQSVGVGVPAPTANGAVHIGSVNATHVSSGSLLKLSAAGTVCESLRANSLATEGFICANSNFELGSVTNSPVNFYQNNTVRGSITTAGVLNMVAGFSVNGTALPSPASILTTASSLNAANLSGTVAVPVSTTTGVFSTSLTVAGQNVCQANGTNCPAPPAVPTVARAAISGIAACSASSALRVTGCTRASAGNYSVTFTGGTFSTDPICAATEVANVVSTNHITVQTFNANQLTVRTANSAGTATDINFNLVCIGG